MRLFTVKPNVNYGVEFCLFSASANNRLWSLIIALNHLSLLMIAYNHFYAHKSDYKRLLALAENNMMVFKFAYFL